MAQIDRRPTTSDPYEDHQAARALATRCREEWGRAREPQLRNQWRNLLFYRGHQWIFFHHAMGRFQPVRSKSGTPFCVTNRFASTMDGFSSILTRLEARFTARAATEDPSDRAAADVFEQAMSVIEHEVELPSVKDGLGNWVALTGGAWLETGFDNDPRWGTVDVGAMQCAASPGGGCGFVGMTGSDTCPGCGGPLQPAIDPATQQPIVQSTPRGRLFVDVVPMFEMYFDPSIPEWSKQTGYCRVKSLSLDEAKRRWPEVADSIVPDTSANTSEVYADQAATLAGYVDQGTGGPFGAGQWGALTGGLGPRVSETWFWQLPTEVYPEGLLTITLGMAQTVYCGPLPYTALQPDGSRQPFLPTVWFAQKLVPGSAYPKTIADDLAAKQVQRNQIETLMMRIAQRMANPVWLRPSGANISSFPSDPGGVIDYNAFGTAKPERIPGQPITPGLVQFIAQIDRDFEEESALYEIMKGGRPPGVSAGVSLQLLQERAMHRFGPMLIRWSKAWGQWAGQATEIARQYWTEDRFVQIQGQDGTWQVQKFMVADLAGRVDIVPEAEGSLPRSTMVERAEIEQMISLGALDLRDPAVRFKVLQKYNLGYLLETLQHDTKNAIIEQEQFQALADNPTLHPIVVAELSAYMAAVQAAQQPPPMVPMAGPMGPTMRPGPPPPPPPTYQDLVGRLKQQGVTVPFVRPFMDDHGVHSKEHRACGKAEHAYWRWPEPVIRLYELHIAEHDRLLAEREQTAPPRVAVNVRGELAPPDAQRLVGLEPTAPPLPAAGGTGLLTPTRGEGSGNRGRAASGRGQNPLRTGSSDARMRGEQREMTRNTGTPA